MLAVVLRDHRAALRASLRSEYQIDLRDELSGDDANLLDLADLVEWLPAGSAVWRSLGGPAAITAEQRDLRKVKFAIQVLEFVTRGQGAKQPKPEPEPEWAYERQAQGDALSAKAAAHAARAKARST